MNAIVVLVFLGQVARSDGLSNQRPQFVDWREAAFSRLLESDFGNWREDKIDRGNPLRSSSQSRPRSPWLSTPAIMSEYTHRFRLMTLRQGTTALDGTAWLIDFQINDKGRNNIMAYRGRYEVASKAKDPADELKIRFFFSRRYNCSMGARMEWSIDGSYRGVPTGALVEIPLDDGRVPNEEITLVVTDGYLLDEDLEIVREPRIFIQGRPVQNLNPGFTKQGEVLKLTNESAKEGSMRWACLALLHLDPPPAYKLVSIPKVPAEAMALAGTFIGHGFPNISIGFLTTLLKKDPAKLEAYLVRSSCLLMVNEPIRALEDAEIVVQTKNTTAELTAGARFLLAQGYLQQQEYLKVSTELYQTVNLCPKNAKYQNGLAWLLATCPLQSVRAGAAALDHAKIACENTKYDNSAYILTLAVSYAAIGNYKEAVKWHKRACELSPNDVAKWKTTKEAGMNFKTNRPYHE